MTSKNMTGSYEESLHRLGKIFAAAALIIIVGIPFAIMLRYQVMPPWLGFLGGLAGVAAIYVPVGIIEFFTYVPMLGTGSSYLMFVTGNLTNLKVPCALNALEVAEIKPGTKEADIIATISVATSAIVTDIIIIIGVRECYTCALWRAWRGMAEEVLEDGCYTVHSDVNCIYICAVKIIRNHDTCSSDYCNTVRKVYI